MGSRILRIVFLIVFAAATATGGFLLLKGRESAVIHDGDFVFAYRGLCGAQALVAADVGKARDIFYAQSHDALHELARETQEGNRPLTGRLLEAKNVVETDLGASSGHKAEESLSNLLRVSEEALVFLGVPNEPCA